MRTLVVLGIVAAVAAPVMGEMIVNGTFDSNMNGWTAGKASWGNTIPNLISNTSARPWGPSDQSHDNVAELDYGGEFQGNRWIAQTVSGLTVGTTYTLSGLAAGGAGGAQAMGGSSWWQIGYTPGGYNAGNLDSGATCTNVLGQTVNGVGGFDWTSGSGSFVASQTSYTIYAKYGASGTNWNYYGVFFDNISLTPEPTSLLLLGLGLPMLRRRR